VNKDNTVTSPLSFYSDVAISYGVLVIKPVLHQLLIIMDGLLYYSFNCLNSLEQVMYLVQHSGASSLM
jgi:hypothetical protein